MKSIFKKNSLLLTSICMVLVIIILSTNCQNNQQKPQVTQESQDTQNIISAPVSTNFETTPPIVEQLFIKRLDQPTADGSNVLLFAQFSQSEASKLRQVEALTINLEDNRGVKFTDNGQNGDLKRSDGIFTASLKVNEDELSNLIKQDNEIILKKRGVETVFIGRSATKRKLSPFKLDSFRRGIPVLFDIAFISIVDAATLPGIKDNSLMITHLPVVNDPNRTYDPCRVPKGNPNGAWSFRTLIANMDNGFSTPEKFLTDWIDNFLFSLHTQPSGDATTNRTPSKERLVKAWLKNCTIPFPLVGLPVGWQTNPLLKAQEFPVRLLTIVNRLDLRGNSGYGGFSNAGEGRLVFCFIDSNVGCGVTSNDGNNGPGTMTFIFEYGVPITKCAALQAYATQWWNLRTMAIDPIFNSTLEGITNTFTLANANPARPNSSALNHLRTNDFLSSSVSLSQNPWDIRDFEIDAATHKLKIIHPNKEPMENSNGFAIGNGVVINTTNLANLKNFVNSLPMTVLDPSPPYTIPNNLMGMHAPMRILPPSRYHWRGNTTNVIIPFSRREFSLNTCSGCHKGETRNVFTHVKPRDILQRAPLSGFMTGLGADDNSAVTDIDTDPIGSFFVTDPGPTPLSNQKEFNEALRRAIDLEKLVFGSPCSVKIGFPRDLIAINQILKFRPINMEH